MIWKSLMKACRWCLTRCFKLIGKELTDETWVVCEQFIKFLLVGCSNTLIVLLVYYIFVGIAGTQHYLLGQTLGYGIGILNSFFWNSRFVFSDAKETQGKAFIKMCICYCITYLLQMVLLYAFVELLLISEWLAPIIAIIITTPINFILNKLLAFKAR